MKEGIKEYGNGKRYCVMDKRLKVVPKYIREEITSQNGRTGTRCLKLWRCSRQLGVIL